MVKSKLLLLAVLLVGLGYGMSYWVNGTNVKAQEPKTVVAASRFQVVKTASGAGSDWIILDSVEGRAFRFTSDATHSPELLEIPIKVCNSDDCTNSKRIGMLLQ